MRILFDNNVPLYLAGEFPGHEVATAFRQGWAALQNGKLLDAAEAAGFDLFVTLDKNIRFQQRLTGRKLCIAVLDPQGQSEAEMVQMAGNLVRRLDEGLPGVVVVVSRQSS